MAKPLKLTDTDFMSLREGGMIVPRDNSGNWLQLEVGKVYRCTSPKFKVLPIKAECTQSRPYVLKVMK